MALKKNVKKQTAKKPAAKAASLETPSRLIDIRLEELDDWRCETLAYVRALIKQADPDVVEELKWKKPSNPAGVPRLRFCDMIGVSLLQTLSAPIFT